MLNNSLKPKNLREKLQTLASCATILTFLIFVVSHLIPALAQQPSSGSTVLSPTVVPMVTVTMVKSPTPTPTPEPISLPASTLTPEPISLPASTPLPEPISLPTPTPTPEPISLPANTPPPQHTITDLGNLNFQSYCISIGDTGASLDQNNAYGWRCVTSSGSHILIDTDALCRWQYNGIHILAVMTDVSGPNNWQCYGDAKQLGTANFAGYCQSLGKSASLDGSGAYSWHCVAGGNSLGIDMNALCRWQYSEADAVPRVTDASSSNGWECLGSI